MSVQTFRVLIQEKKKRSSRIKKSDKSFEEAFGLGTEMLAWMLWSQHQRIYIWFLPGTLDFDFLLIQSLWILGYILRDNSCNINCWIYAALMYTQVSLQTTYTPGKIWGVIQQIQFSFFLSLSLPLFLPISLLLSFSFSYINNFQLKVT